MDCEAILVNVLSIIASGIISWIISNAYYKKSNKDLILRIIKPIVTGYSKEKFFQEKYYDDLIDLNSHVELMYLKETDRKVIDEMINALKEYKSNSDDQVFRNAIVEYFIDYFRKQGNNLQAVPITTPDGDLLYYDYVPQVNDLSFNVRQIRHKFSANNDEEWLNESTKYLLNQYAVELGAEQGCFEDVNIHEVVLKSEARKNYILSEKRAKDAVQAFMNLDICQKMIKKDK